MLLNTPHILSAKPRLVIFPIFLFVTCLFFLPRQHDRATDLRQAQVHGQNATQAASTFHATVHSFWQDLAAALLEARPKCDALAVVSGDIPDVTWEPLKQEKKSRDRILGFTDDHEKALFHAHHAMRIAAKNLAPKLPFAANTTGIVTTANVAYMPILIVSLRMLRKTGNDMPVEVFIDDWTTYDPVICDALFPSLNARCVVLSNVYNTAQSAAKPDHFQYKIFAILFSSFQHVLFLDSDSIAAHDPSVLFTAPPYTTHGLVTWPDFWELSISTHFYHIAAIPEEPIEKRLSSESGQLLINKDIHRESLLMMVYYNYYGPDYYYVLLSQGSHGAGDKETFAQAALAVNLPYYQVKTPIRGLGRAVNQVFYFVGMAQADPIHDFNYQTPMPSHIHPDATWNDDDIDIDTTTPDPPSSSPSTTETPTHPPTKTPPTTTTTPPRMFFLHQNLLKTSPHHILDNKKGQVFDADGAPHRMWGPREDMLQQVGYDVEQRLWDVIVEEGCRSDEHGAKCFELRMFNASVFGVPGVV